MRFVLLLSMSLLSGCVSMLVSDDRLESASDLQVAAWYSEDNGARWRQELERRGTFTPEQWKDIDARVFRVGTPEAALVAVRGPGQLREMKGSHLRWRQRQYGQVRPLYVDIDEFGLVRSWTEVDW